MNIMQDVPKDREVYNKCEVCGRKKWCHYHHIYKRKNSDMGIWACPDCHTKIHTNPAWAYEQGYLRKPDMSTPKRKKKEKKCEHSTTIFDARLGYIRCMFCGKRVDAMRYKKTKAKEKSKAIDKE